MYPYPEAPWYGIFVKEQVDALRREGIEVDVSVHLGAQSRWNYLWGVGDLRRHLRSRRYDLIHSHHPYSSFLALAARRLAMRKIPIVQTFHDSEIFRRATDYSQDPLRRLKYSLRLKAWILRRLDFVIPVHCDMLPKVLGDRVGRVRSRIIPAGINTGLFGPEPREEARRRLGWDLAQRYVFFPCDPGKPEKRFDLVEPAMELVRRTHPDARLVVGGRIPYEQMPDTIKASDVVVQPSDYETGPLTVREALSCERPVVATDVGDIKECYQDLPGLFLCDWDVQDVADKLAAALDFGPQPFGGHERILALGLDHRQIAKRVLGVYYALILHEESK